MPFLIALQAQVQVLKLNFLLSLKIHCFLTELQLSFPLRYHFMNPILAFLIL